MLGVITGSMLLGDSIRGTLSDRVHERLGSAHTILTTGTDFICDSVMESPLLADARGYLLMDGYVSVGDRLLPVYVWGTDEDSLSTGQALINQPLCDELSGQQDLVLHLPAHTMVPAGTLFVSKSYSTQMRLHIAGVRDRDHGGNLLLRNEQTLPLNVFVSRRQLSQQMELPGLLNVILSDRPVTDRQFADIWSPAFSGIHVTDTSVTASRIFLSDTLVHRLHPSAICFSYLVNELIHNTDTVPYSFVTATDHWHGRHLTGRQILLSDYAAHRLHVGRGDSVRMSYFVQDDLKRLQVHEQTFLVTDVVPLATLEADTLLRAEFPGLSNVNRCADWDSDLPIRMDHIHQTDEDYWYAHRNTPKALVSLDAVRPDWSNSYGSATALRFQGLEAAQIRARIGHSFASNYVTVLDGVQQQGLYAATHGTDFTSLFLALGFFIILSAVLLMASPLSQMYAARASEMQLYLQMGYTRTRILRLLFRESFTLMLTVTPVGVMGGLLYSSVTLWLLGNVWSGATHTQGFALHVQPLTLVLGWLSGVIICALVLMYILRQQLRPASPVVQASVQQLRRKTLFSIILFIATIALVVYNFMVLHSLVLFVVCGLLWIVVFGLLLHVYICNRARVGATRVWSRTQLILNSIYAARHQHQITYWSLSLGVFTVFAVGLNRPDFTDQSHFLQATGGYQLYVDSRIPIHYDLTQSQVRHRLSLDELSSDARILPFLRHTQDEASCLNLNRVSTPTVLGIDLRHMQPFGLEADGSAHSIPSVYIDQESLIWSLMKQVGDTLHYTDSRGRSVPVLIAGTYPTGIFHGNAIMSDTDFRQMWPQETGINVFLVQTPRPDDDAMVLSTALAEYGLQLHTTTQRIQLFFTVTDTYLIIFLTLGGLGVLLGILSLVITTRRNLVSQHTNIQQYSHFGFNHRFIYRLLYVQNVSVPVYAVIVGTLGSVISISANVFGAGVSTLLLALLCLCLLFVAVCMGIRIITQKYIKQNLI